MMKKNLGNNSNLLALIFGSSSVDICKKKSLYDQHCLLADRAAEALKEEINFFFGKNSTSLGGLERKER